MLLWIPRRNASGRWSFYSVTVPVFLVIALIIFLAFVVLALVHRLSGFLSP
jgi:hypothetical protein